MAKPAEVHVALIEQLRRNINRVGELNFAAFPSAGVPVPKIEIYPGSPWVIYRETYGPDGVAGMNVVITVTGKNGDGDSAGRLMSDLLTAGGTTESSSICDAVMVDVTLGGVVSVCLPQDPDWDVNPDTFESVGRVPCVIRFSKSGANA